MGFEHLLDCLKGLLGEGNMTAQLSRFAKAVRENGEEPELLSYGILISSEGHVVLWGEGDKKNYITVLIEHRGDKTTH